MGKTFSRRDKELFKELSRDRGSEDTMLEDLDKINQTFRMVEKQRIKEQRKFKKQFREGM